ncbi:hypothetical protein [Blastopirellula marina]|uniref:Uncharacterized protein n=1 Tax=Blastopirellula marina DSM 3645 TaxID=314230 RepID=A3ZRK3_9BACT|nr:hypothetical protein [Blastopirellula marina]EAQ80772.1 hypothetical protein DSM3645_12166 [Blastopirellula marina DSM 3645]
MLLVKHLVVIVGLTALGFAVPIAHQLRETSWGEATAAYQVAPAAALQIAVDEARSLVIGTREFALQLRGETIDKWDDIAASRFASISSSEHGALGLAFRWSLLMTVAYLALQLATLFFGVLSRANYLANIAIIGGIVLFLTGSMPAAGLLAIAVGMILKLGQILDHFTTVKPAAEF